MTVFSHPDFAAHEQVVFHQDDVSGLKAIIAVHSTVLGPAVGGCRFRHYPSDADALADVLRLSRGMTCKNALAGLPLGGGKAVILASPEEARTPALLERFGALVESLGGAYVTAEDVGIGPDDLQVVRRRTGYVSGLGASRTNGAGGNPAPWTARGVFHGIEAAVRWRLDRVSLDGVRVAVMGLGAVGAQLCRLLRDAGASLVVADVNPGRAAEIGRECQATVVSPEGILRTPADVLAPCALGGVLNERSIPHLAVRVVAGAANNQLAEAADAERLRARGILYAPDFVINAGGIISVGYEYLGGFDQADVAASTAEIGPRLTALFAQADEQGGCPEQVALMQAQQRVADAGRSAGGALALAS